MTQQNNIIPPSELVQQWEEDWHHSKVTRLEFEPYIAAQAAQWGADQELEACRQWLEINGAPRKLIDGLLVARRPKPPSLKEQALDEIDRIPTHDSEGRSVGVDVSLLRRALKSIPDPS